MTMAAQKLTSLYVSDLPRNINFDIEILASANQINISWCSAYCAVASGIPALEKGVSASLSLL